MSILLMSARGLDDVVQDGAMCVRSGFHPLVAPSVDDYGIVAPKRREI